MKFSMSADALCYGKPQKAIYELIFQRVLHCYEERSGCCQPVTQEAGKPVRRADFSDLKVNSRSQGT